MHHHSLRFAFSSFTETAELLKYNMKPSSLMSQMPALFTLSKFRGDEGDVTTLT